MKAHPLPKSLSAPRLQAVILAAGFSSRLGNPKAMARVGAQSLLRRTIALASSLKPAQILIVVPRRASSYRTQARGFKVIFAANPHRAGHRLAAAQQKRFQEQALAYASPHHTRTLREWAKNPLGVH